MATIIVRNYRPYLEMDDLDSLAVIEDIAQKYISSWLNDTDLDINGAFHYYENRGLIEAEYDEAV